MTVALQGTELERRVDRERFRQRFACVWAHLVFGQVHRDQSGVHLQHVREKFASRRSEVIIITPRSIETMVLLDFRTPATAVQPSTFSEHDFNLSTRTLHCPDPSAVTNLARTFGFDKSFPAKSNLEQRTNFNGLPDIFVWNIFVPQGPCAEGIDRSGQVERVVATAGCDAGGGSVFHGNHLHQVAAELKRCILGNRCHDRSDRWCCC